MSDEFDIPFDDTPLPSADGIFPPRPSRQELDARAANGQSRKTGKRLWVQLPAYWMGDAWRGMTPAAKAVVERVLGKFTNTPPAERHNGKIVVTYDEFEAHGIRRKSIPDAIRRAEELGFIIVKRGQGGKVGHTAKASVYGLTFLPWGAIRDADEGSHEWASARCEDMGRRFAAEQTLKHRKNPIGEANLNVVRLTRARRKLAGASQ